MCVLRRLETELALRDTEQVPLPEPGGVETFFHREVLPHLPDARVDPGSIKTGYEISFTRYFYQPQPLRTIEETRTHNLAMEKASEGVLDALFKASVQ
jgi:type I restriction enzyme M protein